MLPKAVIDLGTNTFHLLVAHCRDRVLTTVHRERHFVKLARQGIERIHTGAVEDAMAAAHQFRHILSLHQVEDVSVLGTAALRMAENARDLNHQLEQILGHPIDVIDGNREAQLIARGVTALMDDKPGCHLIMDIGGGSVEFILMEGSRQVHHASLPIGVAILHHRFHKNDPILHTEIRALQAYIDRQLDPLRDHLRAQQIDHLIGAAGIYEVLAQRVEDQEDGLAMGYLEIGRLEALLETLRHQSLEERMRSADIPPERADLIVSSLLLINRIIFHFRPKRIAVSPYAMKEGRLLEMFAGSTYSSSNPD